MLVQCLNSEWEVTYPISGKAVVRTKVSQFPIHSSVIPCSNVKAINLLLCKNLKHICCKFKRIVSNWVEEFLDQAFYFINNIKLFHKRSFIENQWKMWINTIKVTIIPLLKITLNVLNVLLCILIISFLPVFLICSICTKIGLYAKYYFLCQ